MVLKNTHDVTYYAWFAGIWTLPEMAAGFVVASLPVARIFFDHLINVGVFSRIASSFGQSASKPNPSSSEQGLSNTMGRPRRLRSSHSVPGRLWERAYGVSGGLRLLETDASGTSRTKDTSDILLEDGTNQHPRMYAHQNAQVPS